MRGRGAALATAAAIFGALTKFCGAILNVLVGFNLAAVTQGHLSRPAAETFLVTTFQSAFARGLADTYIAGIVLAPIMMGIALWRGRDVLRWLIVVFVASLELAQQTLSRGPIVAAICVTPFALVTIFLGLRVWNGDATREPFSPAISGELSKLSHISVNRSS